ncbi:MAG: S-adenosylmethionine:tRNA ribosyltransferase-isomerase [Ferruginibacter sp.]
MNPAEISILDYSYHLPDDRIALHPLPQRDASRLLVYKDGQITKTVFSAITDLLPAGSLLVINNTRVINARIVFQKSTGARIEIFCLEPLGAISEYQSVMSATGRSVWKCFIGGAAKWKEPFLEKKLEINGVPVLLKATLLSKEGDAYSVELSWESAHFSFAEIIAAAGYVPLPPYIKRTAEVGDSRRYQTVFAKEEGSVAAPTAGLHFTDAIFEQLEQKDVQKAFVTLHVGAGTFKPVKAATMQEHEMHAEYIDVNIAAIDQLRNKAGHIAAVGTTACRTIESLYWMGVKAMLNPNEEKLAVAQWDVYREPLLSARIAAADALDALAGWMRKKGVNNIFTHTQLMIAPGYRFRLVNMLVTNFHQPQSTLLLLVAAAIGDDWKKMYAYALNNDFRFLSYGDANLLFLGSASV